MDITDLATPNGMTCKLCETQYLCEIHDADLIAQMEVERLADEDADEPQKSAS